MLGWLETIACWLANMGKAVLWAICEAFNALIRSAEFVLVAALHLLPPMPPFPEFDSGVMGWVAWFLPMNELIAGFAVVTTLFLLTLAVRVVLRWLKALQ